jgi:hypothetical protein
VSTASSHFLAKKNGPARKAWNEAVQTRVSATNHVLGQVKGIKMTGLAPFVVEHLQDLRVTEIDKSKDLRKVIIYMHALGKRLEQLFSVTAPLTFEQHSSLPQTHPFLLSPVVCSGQMPPTALMRLTPSLRSR